MHRLQRARLFVLVGVCALLATHVLQAHRLALATRLPPCVVGALVDAEAQILAVEAAGAGAPYHQVELRLPVSVAGCVRGERRLRLSWNRTLGLPQSGERWRVQAKVRAPWSMRNPGGFDYERWLLARRVDGTGYVRGAELLGSGPAANTLQTVRAQLGARIDAESRHPGIARALTLGDARHIGQAVWSLLRDTGTVHLLVVSGLHVGIAASFALLLTALLVRCLPGATAYLPAARCARAGGVLGAAAYVVLVGFDVPVTRALCMAAVAGIAVLASRRLGAWQCYCVALAVTLAGVPLAPLEHGFWLSFGAVGVLLLRFSNVRCAPRGMAPVRTLAQAQSALFIGMFPLLAAFTGQWAWVAPVANAVAVPLVSIAIVPPLLAHAFLPVQYVARWSLRVGDHAVTMLLELLQMLAVPAVALAEQPLALVLLCIAAAAAWLLPLPRRWRVMLLPALAAPLAPAGSPLPEGVFRVHVLDVGQGSAAIVETRESTLLFDAGARYPSGFDIGERVVLPALAQLPRRQLDRLVVSHPDNDHAGGAEAVRGVHGDALLIDSDGCHAHPAWQQDGVRFRFLTHPRIRQATSDNDRSCTLLVESGHARALLTGDTSARYETFIVRQAGGPVDLLLAPHHGSISSSSPGFVSRLSPGVVVFSAGRGNRYKHPHAQVVARFRRAGSRLFVTHEHGMLRWRSDGGEVISWRAHAARYWTQRVSM